MLNKDLSKCVEFMIETERKDTEPVTSETRPTSFTITPESLQNVKDVRTIIQAINYNSSLSLIC